MSDSSSLSFKEKLGYALGDGAANIAWRGVATFLFIYYTDVFGLDPVSVGVLMLVARFSDGISDVLMGVIGDRTRSKYGKFRPWILWTALPLGLILALLFTNPGFGDTGNLIYAYITYIFFTLIYTANNIPYGALMAVMTGDDKERTSLGSFRMAGAFGGGMLVQGALLFLVLYFGNVAPDLQVEKEGEDQFKVEITANKDVENVRLSTKNGIAEFQWLNEGKTDQPSIHKQFTMEEGEVYSFTLTGDPTIESDSIQIIDQNKGYSRAMYIMSVFLALFMLITFYSTRERVQPPANQKNDIKRDLKELIRNKPWIILLFTGLLFNVYNSIKQGIVLIYFSHYLQNQLLAASYLVVLMIASVIGALITASLSRKLGKKKLFVFALIFSGLVNIMFLFPEPGDYVAVFVIGSISELASAIFPTLFFVMLGDAADYSEYINKRRATGLIYSAGSFATKFGGGIAGAIIGAILGAYLYDGKDAAAIKGAIPGIKMLMSWVPAVITFIAAILMLFYPLNENKLSQITTELNQRRTTES